MRTILFLIIAAAATFGAACTGSVSNTKNGGTEQAKDCSVGIDTPTEAYKRLFAAVKAKDTDAIMRTMTKKSQEFIEGIAEKQKKTLPEVYVNGFTATTFAETLPEIRDERVSGCNAAVEVRNAKDQRWEDLPLMAEDGLWKFAYGEMFADTYKSPGKGRSTIEREAANTARGGLPEGVNIQTNSNTSTKSNSNAKSAPKYDGPQVEPMPKNK
jgi:hypothetical protein